MAHQNILDKTAKIVFASNVPIDMAEDRIREIFARVGSISSFRVICNKDRECGKTKVYVICEYKDQETALSAVKSLGSIEVAGRYMKVDHALSEKSRLEMISLMQNSQNTDGSSEKTPETISRAVASLPPEQMFELLKQMKQCVQNNSNEAKIMLLQNPQLAYALLQALVVMRVVDPVVAVTALNNASNIQIPNIMANNDSTISASSMINRISSSVNNSAPPVSMSSTSRQNISAQQPVPPPAPTILHSKVLPTPVVHEMDMRGKQTASISRAEPDKVKSGNVLAANDSFKRDPRLQARNTTAAPANASSVSVPSAPCVTPVNPQTSKPTSVSNTSAESEKTALIMQVLRLTDAQIAMLPPEQRQSILLLKEQIAKAKR